ncbi:MAG: CRISPR-associated protein Cas4 [Planctomycetales bacterium]|nr:CRISPR-associated protein Cas4 [Planctomycetales bacterium]
MYPESDLIPLSALQHLLFCERQCALIHLERVWVENRYTAEGAVLHRKAHDGKPQTRDGVRITRGLPIRSLELGLSGQTDVVLWKPPDDANLAAASRTLRQALRNADAYELRRWTVTPVEYKRGRPKKNDCDRVQLAAQALCLEEMLGVEIPAGQLFYGRQRRRQDVEIDDALRTTARQAARRLHELFDARRTPPAVREKKCDTCSLLPVCLPAALGPRRSARQFFERQLADSAE